MKKKYSALALTFIIAISSIASSVVETKIDSPQPTKSTRMCTNNVDPERENVD